MNCGWRQRCLPAHARAWRPALRVVGLMVVLLGGAAAGAAQPRAYRLPDVDLKQPVIWGAVCESPDGFALAFGGQDQHSDDPNPHTRVRIDGQWKAIHEELRAASALQPFHARIWASRSAQKDAVAKARAIWFAGLPSGDAAKAVAAELVPRQQKVLEEVRRTVAELEKAAGALKDKDYELAQAQLALALLRRAAEAVGGVVRGASGGVSAELVAAMIECQVMLEKCAEMVDAEPPPRALSPLVWEPRSRMFVLFGGDHLDYLTCDTWVFDPAKRKWMQRHPPAAPSPRANHKLAAPGDGTVVLSGGYVYADRTGYCDGQYCDTTDGPWTYDVAADRWKGEGPTAAPDARTYRGGPFSPAFFMRDPAPDARATAEVLAKLPVNTWVSMRPPHLPRLNRDWGTAVLDTDRDLILRWSGGHSAHGGTDVLHYHLRTNRWELPCQVEFPLGQLYSNTSYPLGMSFNLRPWITGHTYQSYGYDATARKMLFVGQRNHTYFYDPDIGDWAGRSVKPKEMVYGDCFYTLTLCPTPQGLVCWTQNGHLLRFDAAAGQWQLMSLSGAKLPGSVVDNSTVVYDSRRNRLLLFRKGYGDKHRYDGRIWSVDLAGGAVSELSPRGAEAAADIPYLCQIRYDIEHDLLLVGGLLPADQTGRRRTPAYDCAGDRWVSLDIAGDDPNGKTGRNVSLGLMYDPARKLFWAVDTNSNVFVLRLDPQKADMRDMQRP